MLKMEQNICVSRQNEESKEFQESVEMLLKRQEETLMLIYKLQNKKRGRATNEKSRTDKNKWLTL